MLINFYCIEEEVQELIDEYICSSNLDEVVNVLVKAKEYSKKLELEIEEDDLGSLNIRELQEIRHRRLSLYNLIYEIDKKVEKSQK